MDKAMIPTGEISTLGFSEPRPIAGASFDTGFRLAGVREAFLRSGELRLCYWQDSQFPFLQVFIPPARQSIALEPMTQYRCLPTVLARACKMLRPGAKLAGLGRDRRL
ncbi:MAG: hypothetical protein IPJ00_10925 [Saprospirales bacterium]|nr:hypothetical protein [Saprospirales bacterium]